MVEVHLLLWLVVLAEEAAAVGYAGLVHLGAGGAYAGGVVLYGNLHVAIGLQLARQYLGVQLLKALLHLGPCGQLPLDGAVQVPSINELSYNILAFLYFE